MGLHELLEDVADDGSFLLFVKAFIEDRQADARGAVDDSGRGERGWENHSIESFLEAALAWAEATNIGASQGLADASPWKRFAVFLYCGKIYE